MTAPITFEHFDRALRPQDDLFRHVNGTWLRTAAIAPDRSSAGGFVDLVEQAEKDVLALVGELPAGDVTTDDGKVAALYAASVSGSHSVSDTFTSPSRARGHRARTVSRSAATSAGSSRSASPPVVAS